MNVETISQILIWMRVRYISILEERMTVYGVRCSFKYNEIYNFN